MRAGAATSHFYTSIAGYCFSQNRCAHFIGYIVFKLLFVRVSAEQEDIISPSCLTVSVKAGDAEETVTSRHATDLRITHHTQLTSSVTREGQPPVNTHPGQGWALRYGDNLLKMFALVRQ